MPKTIVITGASSGIGAAAAAQLAARGDRVVLAARRGDELDRLAQQLGPQRFPS
jgi:short-subunit dehydrogenase